MSRYCKLHEESMDADQQPNTSTLIQKRHMFNADPLGRLSIDLKNHKNKKIESVGKKVQGGRKDNVGFAQQEEKTM